MPDLLTHYTLSYLIASRTTKPKQALLIAMVGLLPDIDVLLRIHRWITHSLILTTMVGVALTLMTLHLGQPYLKYMLTALTLYTTHIIMDLFTAATPILWPLTSNAYMINLELTGTITGQRITLTPIITVTMEQVDFTPKPVLEGPIITPLGAITALATTIIVLTEYITFKQKSKRGKNEIVK